MEQTQFIFKALELISSFLDILETAGDNTIQYTKEFKQYLEDGTMPRFVRYFNMEYPNRNE